MPKPQGPASYTKCRRRFGARKARTTFVERLKIARDHPIVADFAVPMALGDRNVNGFFVDIQPYEHATVPHDLPPRVWRCAKRQALRIIHDVTRGRSTRSPARSQPHWTIYPPPSRPPPIAGPAQAAID